MYPEYTYSAKNPFKKLKDPYEKNLSPISPGTCSVIILRPFG
jgi:hypothetical protein